MSARSSLRPDQFVAAPRTGIHLGRNKGGDVALRLFRPRGTRIVAFTDPRGPQLVALRAALSRSTVRIASSREHLWSGILNNAPDAVRAPAEALRHGAAGPTLLVDDHPEARRPLGEVAEWQCLIELRDLAALGTQGSPVSRLAPFGHADIGFFGTLDRDHADAVGQAFGLGEGAAALTVVPRHAVAVVARGTLQLVRLEPTPAERGVLGWNG